MCAKQSLKQPVSARVDIFLPLAGKYLLTSLIPGNTIRSGYHSWRLTPRGDGRSPVRNDAGRNVLSDVKVSSPVKQYVPEWPSEYVEAKATPEGKPKGTLGVQVHGMYRRLFQELGRSLMGRPERVRFDGQSIRTKSKIIPIREVRWSRSSGEVR